MDNPQNNLVLAREDGLVEKIEEGLFAFLDWVVFSEFEGWSWNSFCRNTVHIFL